MIVLKLYYPILLLQNTKKDIIVVVQNCPKQRFSLKEEEGKTFIKACQGHSIKVYI